MWLGEVISLADDDWMELRRLGRVEAAVDLE
jgi:hypothetical protein